MYNFLELKYIKGAYFSTLIEDLYFLEIVGIFWIKIHDLYVEKFQKNLNFFPTCLKLASNTTLKIYNFENTTLKILYLLFAEFILIFQL